MYTGGTVGLVGRVGKGVAARRGRPRAGEIGSGLEFTEARGADESEDEEQHPENDGEGVGDGDPGHPRGLGQKRAHLGGAASLGYVGERCVGLAVEAP